MAENHEMTLFIGGPWDGRQEDVACYGGNPVWPKITVVDGRSYGGTAHVERCVYERKVFHACGKQFVFRVPSGMTEAELMGRLIHGYRPAKEVPNV